MWRNSLKIFVLLWIARLLMLSRTMTFPRSFVFRTRYSTFSMMFSSIVGDSTWLVWACFSVPLIMICEMQSTNQMWSIGISRTSSALMMERDGIVLVTYRTSRSFCGAKTSRMSRIASKYWSAPMRSGTALPSGSSTSLSRSLPAISSTSGGDAPALEQRDEEHAGRREVEHVLRAGVLRAAHLHDLQGAQEVAAPLQVPHHDDPVRDRLLHPVRRVPLPRRRDLGDEERRAPQVGQDRAELQDELPHDLLGLQAVGDGRHGVDDEAAGLQLLHEADDGVDQDVDLLVIELRLDQPEPLINDGDVDEVKAALVDETAREEVVRDDVRKELVRGLRDGDEQARSAGQAPGG